MSRNYEVQVEIVPCSEEELDRFTSQLRDWGMSIEDQTDLLYDERGDGRAFWGSMQLCGGETEDAVHQKLANRFADRWVRTCWRYLDDLPWDEDFESDPLTTPPCSIPTIQPIQ